MAAAGKGLRMCLNNAAKQFGKCGSNIDVDSRDKVNAGVSNRLDIALHKLWNDNTAHLVQRVGNLSLNNIVVRTKNLANLRICFETLVVLAICNECIQ